MRFYSNGNWSVGPVGAFLLSLFYLALAPIWLVVGAYKIDVRFGHVALAVMVVLFAVAAMVGH